MSFISLLKFRFVSRIRWLVWDATEHIENIANCYYLDKEFHMKTAIPVLNDNCIYPKNKVLLQYTVAP